jgi:hypothetical protein
MGVFFAKLKTAAAVIGVLAALLFPAGLLAPMRVDIGDGSLDLPVHLNSAADSKVLQVKCYAYDTFAAAKAVSDQGRFFVDRDPDQIVTPSSDTFDISLRRSTRTTHYPLGGTKFTEFYPKGLLIDCVLENGQQIRTLVEVNASEKTIEVRLP